MAATTHDLVAKRRNLCNVLKDAGVKDQQSMREHTDLLELGGGGPPRSTRW